MLHRPNLKRIFHLPLDQYISQLSHSFSVSAEGVAIHEKKSPDARPLPHVTETYILFIFIGACK